MGSMLRCVQCPEVGGDTIWINMAAAYENLPDDVKARIANLKAVHDFLPLFGIAVPEDQHAAMREKFPPVEHPVVRTHPESGEKILYVNEAFTTHLSNLRPGTAQEYRIGFDYKLAEMDLLQLPVPPGAGARISGPPQWHPNTIAFWDNRSCQHYAVQDYFPAPRHMMRATVIGDRPVVSRHAPGEPRGKRNENARTLFISMANGSSRPPAARSWTSIDPATETLTGELAMGTAQDADRAVAAAPRRLSRLVGIEPRGTDRAARTDHRMLSRAARRHR